MKIIRIFLLMMTVACHLIFAADLSKKSASIEKLVLAKLKYDGGGNWYINPASLPNLAITVCQRTKLPLSDTTTIISLDDPALFSYPFLFVTGNGTIAFTPTQRVRLRDFLAGGGFLWVDDSYGIDTSFRREMASMFPDNPLILLPSSHPIFSSFYKLPGLPKIHVHDGKPQNAYGIMLDGRMVVLYTFSSDIGDGMENQATYNDTPQLHELALKMGVNVVNWFFSSCQSGVSTKVSK